MSKMECTSAPTDRNFHYWSSRSSLSASLQNAVMAADILLVPWEGFGEYPGLLYPVGTEGLFLDLRERAPSGMQVELAVEDDEYKEVAIHGDIVRIAEFLVTSVAAPVVAILIAEYLKAQLGSRFSKTQVEASITIDQDRDGQHSAIRVSYRGPATAFDTALKRTLKALTSGRKKAGQSHKPRSPRFRSSRNDDSK